MNFCILLYLDLVINFLLFLFEKKKKIFFIVIFENFTVLVFDFNIIIL